MIYSTRIDAERESCQKSFCPLHIRKAGRLPVTLLDIESFIFFNAIMCMGQFQTHIPARKLQECSDLMGLVRLLCGGCCEFISLMLHFLWHIRVQDIKIYIPPGRAGEQ